MIFMEVIGQTLDLIQSVNHCICLHVLEGVVGHPGVLCRQNEFVGQDKIWEEIAP